MPTITLLPPSLDITVLVGDDYVLNLTFTDGVSPFNLTGYTWQPKLKLAKADVATITPEILTMTTTSPSAGTATLAIGGANSRTVFTSGGAATQKVYYFDLQGKDAGNKVKTFVTGTLTLVQDVVPET